MGRTLQPYSAQISMIEERFRDYRRALRKEDRIAFDRLMAYAKEQLQAGVMAAHPHPFDSMVLSMVIRLLQQNESLQYEVDRLKEQMQSINLRLKRLEPHETDP